MGAIFPKTFGAISSFNDSLSAWSSQPTLRSSSTQCCVAPEGVVVRNSASSNSGSSPRMACAWARVQYWHLLVADTTAATISRSARDTPYSSNITGPTWTIRVFMMLGLRLLTA